MPKSQKWFEYANRPSHDTLSHACATATRTCALPCRMQQTEGLSSDFHVSTARQKLWLGLTGIRSSAVPTASRTSSLGAEAVLNRRHLFCITVTQTLT
jgi:hypothetical protein